MSMTASGDSKATLSLVRTRAGAASIGRAELQGRQRRPIDRDVGCGRFALLEDAVEPVADAVDGRDPEGKRLEGLELLAQPAHVDVDGLALAKELRPPDPPDQLLARVHPAGVGEQEREEIELLGREAQAFLPHPHRPRAAIEPEFAEFLDLHDAAFLGGGLGTAQQRHHAGGELRERERLGHVVVGADAKADDLVQLAVARAQHQHGGRGLLAEDATHLEAAELGKHQVEHDEIRAQLPGLLERLDAVGRLAHLVSLAHEVEAEGLSDDLLVLDHQDVLRSHDTG